MEGEPSLVVSPSRTTGLDVFRQERMGIADSYIGSRDRSSQRMANSQGLSAIVAHKFVTNVVLS
jgi:hypothetical protein